MLPDDGWVAKGIAGPRRTVLCGLTVGGSHSRKPKPVDVYPLLRPFVKDRVLHRVFSLTVVLVGPQQRAFTVVTGTNGILPNADA